MKVAGGIVVLTLACGVAAALPSAEELFDKIDKKGAEIENISCDLKLKVDAEGTKVSGEGKMVSAYEKAKEGDARVRKFVMESKTKMDADGQVMEVQQKSVCDGETVWMESRSTMMPGGVMVMKMPADMHNKGAKMTDDPVNMTKSIREAWDVKVTAEDTLDGVKTWVLEGTPKEGANTGFEGASKLKLWVGQDDLMMRQFAAYGAEGAEMIVATMSNLKINQKLAADTFKYVVPPGAQVQDMGAMIEKNAQ
jgi:outer membrane lipoprotein-sorting protein